MLRVNGRFAEGSRNYRIVIDIVILSVSNPVAGGGLAGDSPVTYSVSVI